jgi:hypothetical protein
MRTIEQMVNQEVSCCLSSLIHTLATGDVRSASTELAELCDRALGLAMPVPDYEEAALQANWEPYTDRFGVSCWRNDAAGIEPLTWAGDAQSLCEAHDIDPIDSEVYEHWAVSQWLADKLIAQGEKVDTDFAAPYRLMTEIMAHLADLPAKSRNANCGACSRRQSRKCHLVINQRCSPCPAIARWT